jgi:predicted dehydrogenase
MPKERAMLRVGFIGTGSISAVHLNYLKTRPDVEIAALCDVHAANLAKRQQEYGGKAYDKLEAMLDQERLDAVWVCTPATVRREPLLACASRGLPVMCEKPAARTWEEAAAIAAELDALDAAQRVQIGYLFRSIDAVQRCRALLADDTVYQVQSVYACPSGLGNGPWSWFFNKPFSGGPLIDQGTHTLDVLRYLLGDVVAVRGLASNPRHTKSAEYSIEEVAAVALRFASGALGTHLQSVLGEGWRDEVLLIGAKRTYRLDLNNGVLIVEQGKERETVTASYAHAHDPQNVRFLAAVAGGDWSQNPCPYADAARTLKLALECDAACTAP